MTNALRRAARRALWACAAWACACALVAPAQAGEVATVTGRSVLAPCLQDPACAVELGEPVADMLRTAGLAAEAVGMGLSPAISRGSGAELGVSVQSLPLPALLAPKGVDLAPAVPRLSLAGFAGERVRAGGGIEAGGAIPTGGDLGFAGTVRGGVSFGSPDERRWVGFEADGGFGVVTGALFDDPVAALGALPGGAALTPKPCPDPCVDTARVAHVGLDTVLAFDADPSAVLALRFGGVYAWDSLDVGSDLTTWRWSGVLPRVTLAAAYRANPHATVSVAMRVGLLEPSETTNRSRLPWLGSLAASFRFGPERAPPKPLPRPQVATAAAPAPTAPKVVIAPEVPFASHPDLECPEDRLPTGKPPPNGLKAYCVMITDDGHVLYDGPYLEWHDAIQISRRGQFSAGKETGSWTEYDVDGSLLSQGTYANGLREGLWTTYSPEGAKQSEGLYEGGKQTGTWNYWWPNGSRTIGEWLLGQRNGTWVDYNARGTATRQRLYRQDMMTSDLRLTD